MMRSAVRLPMPGTAWKRAASPAAIAFRSSRGRAAGEHRQRHLRAHALHADQHQEELALGLGREAVEVHGVVAHDEMRVERGLAGPRPGRRSASPRRRPGGSPRPRPRSRPRRARGRSPRRDTEAITPAPPSSGAPFAWQMATARASAAWSGLGRLREREQRANHALDLLLLGRAAAAHRLLDRLRRVGEARDAGHPGGQQHDPAGLADREGACARCARSRAPRRPAPPARCSAIRSHTRAWICARRRSSGTPERVSITPPSSAASLRPRESTTP